MTANLHPDVCPSRMRSLCTLALGAAVAALACTAGAACASEPAATATWLVAVAPLMPRPTAMSKRGT